MLALWRAAKSPLSGASDGSVYLEYALTERGRGLYLVLMAIRQWGESCAGLSQHTLVDRRDRLPVRPLAFRAQDGRELGPDEVELIPSE